LKVSFSGLDRSETATAITVELVRIIQISLRPFLVPRRFQWVDLQDRLSPTASGSRQPGVSIALTACKTRSLEGGDDDLPYEEKFPQFRSVTLGYFGFYPVSSKLRNTLTLLTTTGANAVGASDESRAG